MQEERGKVSIKHVTSCNTQFIHCLNSFDITWCVCVCERACISQSKLPRWKGKIIVIKNVLPKHFAWINRKREVELNMQERTTTTILPFNSAGLLYLWTLELTMPFFSHSCIVRQETQWQRKTLYNLLLANCSVLFHGYMSVQAVIVSFIITTCSVVPFRFHHLCSLKKPAAGSRVNSPGATTIRLKVSGCNCCRCTNISNLLPN